MLGLIKTNHEILLKAEELAGDYEKKYLGCCQSTFMAAVDALKWGGAEVFPEAMVDRLFPGLCLLTAGMAGTTEGTCGAISGSALAIGVALGAFRGAGGKDVSVIGDGMSLVQREILDECDKKYRSQLCKDIQRKHYGRCWDFLNPDMVEDYFAVSDGCIIKETTIRAVAAILEELGQVKP